MAITGPRWRWLAAITAAEVLSRAQAGVINLDAPASTYLTHPLLRRNPTVRRLLSNTSGIPEYIAAQVLSDASFGVQDLAYATGPLTDPGQAPQNYSSSNYLLLGMLIENVTCLDYADAVHRDVLAGGDTRFAIPPGEQRMGFTPAPGSAQSLDFSSPGSGDARVRGISPSTGSTRR